MNVYIVKIGNYFNSHFEIVGLYRYKKNAIKYIKDLNYKYCKEHELWLNSDDLKWIDVLKIKILDFNKIEESKKSL